MMNLCKELVHLSGFFTLRWNKSHRSLAFKTVNCSDIANKRNVELTIYNVERRKTVQTIKRLIRNMRYGLGMSIIPPNQLRKKLVVLGSGWGSVNFLKCIDETKYDVLVISPRNYFTFSPLLPSVVSGVLQDRSCVEPIHKFMFRGKKKCINYCQASAHNLDHVSKTVKCVDMEGRTFDVNYDYLVVSVGSQSNTFGITGVAENAFFLKEAENAIAIKRKLLDNCERASLPGVDEDEQKRLMHVVAVGAGPAGVETLAEIADFMKEAIKYYPRIADKIKLTVVEMLPRLLPVMSERCSDATRKIFERLNVDMKLRSRVSEITNKEVKIIKGDSMESLPYGIVIWASGIGQVPFSKNVLKSIPAQQNNRVLTVNESFQVEGVDDGSVFAMGDCSFMIPNPLQNHVDRLYDLAKTSSHGVGTNWIIENKKYLLRSFPQLSESKVDLKSLKRDSLSKEGFEQLLEDIDRKYRPPAPTAQNATQAGTFLATIFNDHELDDHRNLPAFVEKWKGTAAYVGDGAAVVDTPYFAITGQKFSGLFWKTMYWSKQMSIRNRIYLLMDWMSSAVVGRDINSRRYVDSSPKPV